jgi:hypothetical protein
MAAKAHPKAKLAVLRVGHSYVEGMSEHAYRRIRERLSRVLCAAWEHDTPSADRMFMHRRASGEHLNLPR